MVQSDRKTPLISFFTGGGFLDMGFEASGFSVVWTNESDHVIADLYSYGMTAWRNAEMLSPTAAAISNRTSIINLPAARIMRESFGRQKPKHFGIIAGPPCKDFSMGGRHGGENGLYGRLTQVFADRVRTMRPSFFVMENVPGLVKAKAHHIFFEKILNNLEESGYSVDYRILSALEFGVPQNRDRLFVIGVRKGCAMTILGKRLLPGERGWFLWPSTVYPGAKDLPWPQIVDGQTPELPIGIPLELTVFPCLVGPPNPILLPNGRDYFIPRSSRFITQKEGDVYTKSFKRLHRYRYSPTAWYGNNEVHLHPWEDRRISVREALRIQSIPDSYVLPNNTPLSKKFQLICNGVPYLLAKYIAEAVREFLLFAPG